MSIKKIFNFDKFSIAAKKVELVQIYVSRVDHTWIKEIAAENKVKMVRVVSELVDYADNDKEALLYTLSTLKELSIACNSLPIDAELRQRVNTLLDEANE